MPNAGEGGHVPVELHHGEIAEPIRADQYGGAALASRENDQKLLAAIHDVPIGDDMPIRVDDEAGARSDRLDRVESLEHLLIDDRDDRGTHLLHHGDGIPRGGLLLRGGGPQLASGNAPASDQANGQSKNEENTE